MAEQGRAVCFIGAPLCPLVSAVLARGVCAVIPLFCQLAWPIIGIHGNSNAVVFLEIGADRHFDPTGSPGMPNLAAVSCWTELRSSEFSATECTSGRRTSMGRGTAASILQSLILNSGTGPCKTIRTCPGRRGGLAHRRRKKMPRAGLGRGIALPPPRHRAASNRASCRTW